MYATNCIIIMQTCNFKTNDAKNERASLKLMKNDLFKNKALKLESQWAYLKKALGHNFSWIIQLEFKSQ